MRFDLFLFLFFFFSSGLFTKLSSPLAATFPLQRNPSVLFSTRLPPAAVTRTATARAALSLSLSPSPVARGEGMCQGAAGSLDVFFGGENANLGAWGGLRKVRLH